MHDYPKIHRELAKKGVTLTLLWTEYCLKASAAGKKPYIMTEYAYLLDRYRALGGRLITVGTDAHSIPQFGMGLKEAYMLALEKGFESVAVFKRRKCELASIRKLLALE